MPPDLDELRRTAALLNSVFTVAPPYSVERLCWHYEDNPAGRAAVGRVESDTGCGDTERVGNYALVPQTFKDAAGRSVVLGLGVDLAVSSESRGSGAFRRTVEDAYARGRQQGFDAILGVANANSAPRMVSTLGWRALPAFPATLVALAPRGLRMQHRQVDETLLESAWFDAMAGGGFVRAMATTATFDPAWSGEYLRWRLARPGARYHLHVGEDVVVVSTVTTMRRMRFVMVLKVLARRPLDAPLSLGRIARTLAVRHRTPLVVHWGQNPHLRVRGVKLPEAKLPSPLSLVLYGLDDGFDEGGFALGSFEFLDFDAY